MTAHFDRRGFLGVLGGAAAALAFGSGAACASTRMTRPIGLQLYTVRGLMRQDLAGTLARVAEIGYDEVEFHDYFGTAPERVRELLEANGLRAPSLHAPYDALGSEEAWVNVLDAANIVGHEYVVIAWVPPEARRTLDDWQELAARLESAAERAHAAGLRFAYHNHEFEFEEIDGRLPYEIIAATGSHLVELQLDMFWIRKAGHEPTAWFNRFPGRFPSVHVKDMGANGEMVDVGAGIIDWKPLLAQAKAAGAQHFFVEHDQPADPMATIRSSYEYLASLR